MITNVLPPFYGSQCIYYYVRAEAMLVDVKAACIETKLVTTDNATVIYCRLPILSAPFQPALLYHIIGCKRWKQPF